MVFVVLIDHSVRKYFGRNISVLLDLLVVAGIFRIVGRWRVCRSTAMWIVVVFVVLVIGLPIVTLLVVRVRFFPSTFIEKIGRKYRKMGIQGIDSSIQISLFQMQPGDVFVVETPGGGGCGTPESGV